MFLILTYKTVTPDIFTADGDAITQIADPVFISLLQDLKTRAGILFQFENPILYIDYDVLMGVFQDESLAIDFIFYVMDPQDTGIFQNNIVFSDTTPVDVLEVFEGYSNVGVLSEDCFDPIKWDFARKRKRRLEARRKCQK